VSGPPAKKNKKVVVYVRPLPVRYRPNLEGGIEHIEQSVTAKTLRENSDSVKEDTK
jgi:hypothetical protein